MNNAESIRPVFTHLSEVAERTNCAIVLVGHVNKGSSASSDRLLGSTDIYNSVLSAMLVGKIDSAEGVSAMVHHKSNIDELGASQAFRLTKKDGFEWLGECDATAGDVLKESDSVSDGSVVYHESEKLDGASEFLADLLSNGAMASEEVFQISRNHGISDRTLNRAKTQLGVKSFKDGAIWKMKIT